MKRLQNELDGIIENLAGRRPALLLHSCCGPCSSYVLEYLSRHFEITIFYYNPNIMPKEEYDRRLLTQKQLIAQLPFDVGFAEGGYDNDRYLEAVRGLEALPEGGARCDECFRLRLDAAAAEAARRGSDYFCTTLSVSPHKDAEKLDKIAEEAARRHGVAKLPADFKKRGGYLRSCELAKRYGLYRQNYCGCRFEVAKSDEK